MQVLTIHSDVRFRAAQGSGLFFDPVNMVWQDNGTHTENGKGSWVTLDAGTEVMVVMAYDKGDTYCLIVNEDGEGLKSETTYGLVVRQLSMENILENVLVDVHEVEESEDAETAQAEAA